MGWGRVFEIVCLFVANMVGEPAPTRGGFHRQSLRKTHNLNKPARPNQGLGGRVYLCLELPTNIFRETRPSNKCISMRC